MSGIKEGGCDVINHPLHHILFSPGPTALFFYNYCYFHKVGHFFVDFECSPLLLLGSASCHHAKMHIQVNYQF